MKVKDVYKEMGFYELKQHKNCISAGAGAGAGSGGVAFPGLQAEGAAGGLALCAARGFLLQADAEVPGLPIPPPLPVQYDHDRSALVLLA